MAPARKGDAMSEERRADQVVEVAVDGYKVVAYSFGSGDEVVLCVNGGPGLPCDYLREPHAVLADHGYRVVAYDQLGCGVSDRPDDPSLWKIERYARELDTVRETLGLGKVHLLGQSWGGWLSIEYGVTWPQHLKTIILENTCGDMPHLVSQLDQLRAALGPETVAMMQQHEAEGSLEHPEYQAAITILNFRHVCRLKEWPAPLMRSIEGWNQEIYGVMQGPNEFLYTGNLKDWNRIPDMHRITVPALITVGKYDELGPACALRMKHALPDAELVVFPNSSHTPFYEEPEAYYAVLLDFLGRHRSG
jgi:proline iminopeptidase